MHYHLLSVLSTLAAIILGYLATPRWDYLRLKHPWKAVPENWESLGIPSAPSTSTWRSNPIARKPWLRLSTRYGLHLSKQVAELVMPHPHTLELVKSWLKNHGVPMSISPTYGSYWLTLTGISASKANDLFGASYQLYRYAEMKEIIIPGQATSGDIVTALLGRSGYEVAPPFLRWLYNSVSYVPAMDRNVLGIVGYAEEHPNPVDLTTFMDHFRVHETSAVYTVIQVNNGGYDPNNLGLETNMNVRVGDWPEGEDDQYLSWVNYMLDLDDADIPQTISTSYGNYETDLMLDYARAVCDLFVQLGARGVSILFSSDIAGVRI
ncbi:hypothetical protein EDB89DRAFT_2187608 [Lactarius sanguifluus]|nr:hypothetical protein EDB89DRAFT_2187608 [Lactarius sanguifluus]